MEQIFEKIKKLPSVYKILLGCVGAFLFLLILGFVYNYLINNIKSTTVAKISTPVSTSEVSKEKTTMDKAWEALDSSIETRDKYDIQYIEEDKLVRVTKEPADYSDETAFVKITYWDFVRYGIVAFQIDGVENIEFLYWNNFTDSYGKANKEKGVDIAMKKSEFKKYDWPELQGQNIYTQMKTSCYEHYINTAVMKYVKTDKLTLLSL